MNYLFLLCPNRRVDASGSSSIRSITSDIGKDRKAVHNSKTGQMTRSRTNDWCNRREALAQWRTNQRSHTLEVLSDDELRALTRKLIRIVGTKSHDQVANYLKQTVEGYGFTTEWDSFYDQTPMGNKTFHTLVATYDPIVHRRLVLACHYDSKILPGKVFVAATDSAVPCALLLDLAKTLGPLMQARTNKHITLQLLFLDGEEAFVDWTSTDSIYGARHLASNWATKWYPSTDGSAFELSKEIDRMDVMMLLDLLGTPLPQIRSTMGHGTAVLFQNLPEIEQQLKNMNLVKNIPRIFYPGGTYNAVEDDHMPFMKRVRTCTKFDC
uniref:glutaminyl-peptide cyclotransferase n=1 Tax=Ditylenchus dipsaci TaxID=166011 RepID=A0A915EMQ8_9BILA